MPFLHFRFLFLHFCPGSREATFTQNPWNPWVLSVVDQSVMVSPRDRNASPGRGPQECNGCTGWRHRSVGRTTRSGDGALQCWLSPRALIGVLVGDTDQLVARPDLGTGHRSAGCPRERTSMYRIETPLCFSQGPIWGRGIAVLAVSESAHRCTEWRHRSVGRRTRSGDGTSQRWLSPRALVHVLDRNTAVFFSRPDLGMGHRSAACPLERTRCTG